MRKATNKVPVVSLGLKRTCPHCATKFYDFAKPQFSCPKCDKKLTQEDFSLQSNSAQFKKSVKDTKKRTGVIDPLLEEEDVVVHEETAFESTEELDDTDDVDDNIDVSKSGEENDY